MEPWRLAEVANPLLPKLYGFVYLGQLVVAQMLKQKKGGSVVSSHSAVWSDLEGAFCDGAPLARNVKPILAAHHDEPCPPVVRSLMLSVPHLGSDPAT